MLAYSLHQHALSQREGVELGCKMVVEPRHASCTTQVGLNLILHNGGRHTIDPHGCTQVGGRIGEVQRADSHRLLPHPRRLNCEALVALAEALYHDLDHNLGMGKPSDDVELVARHRALGNLRHKGCVGLREIDSGGDEATHRRHHAINLNLHPTLHSALHHATAIHLRRELALHRAAEVGGNVHLALRDAIEAFCCNGFVCVGIDDFQLHIVRRNIGVEAIDKLIAERGVGFRNFCKFHCFSVLGYT